MSTKKKEITDWGETEMLDFLKKDGLEEWKKRFQDNTIADHLDKIGIKKRGDRLTIINTVIKLLGKKSTSKVLNDPIHGLMELDPLLIKIMDTPQFQRLRHIKQLGGAYFVYPGASHNRFEHSVGVAHLAGELARALKSKQPELKISVSDRDILCVQIAGLCHDLGHGPFSHLYDGIFIPKAYAKACAKKCGKACGKAEWKHENASVDMFDHLVKDNGLKPLMKLYGLDPYGEKENDLKFITEMIQGKPLTEAQWPYEGRKEEKSFLYEIVANKLNGIDVDKFDYLARDAYHLGMQSNFDHKRFIMFARVCEVNGRKRICSRDKEVGNLYDMFHTRYCLHRRVCQHKTHKSIEIMISEAFLEADEHIEIEGSGGKKFKLSEAKDDMEAYTKLTDQVFETILHPWSSSPKLEEARKILERIVSRNLYKFVGETKILQQEIKHLKAEVAHAIKDGNEAGNSEVSPKEEGQKQETEHLKAEAAQAIKDGNEAGNSEVTISQEEIDALKPQLAKALFGDKYQPENLEVPLVTFDYGKKDEDPIKNTYFYSKDEPTKGFKISDNQKSKLIPTTFSEKIIRVYCKNAEKVNKDVRDAFKDWCKGKEYLAEPQDEEIAVLANNQGS